MTAPTGGTIIVINELLVSSLSSQQLKDFVVNAVVAN